MLDSADQYCRTEGGGGGQEALLRGFSCARISNLFGLVWMIRERFEENIEPLALATGMRSAYEPQGRGAAACQGPPGRARPAPGLST